MSQPRRSSPGIETIRRSALALIVAGALALGASPAVAAIENNTLGLEEGVQKNGNLEMILWDLAQSAFLKESSVLAEMVQENLNDALDIANRGIKQAPFRVLVGATMPAILLEVAFISNPAEEKGLKSPEFQQTVADAVARAVAHFYGKRLPSAIRAMPPTEPPAPRPSPSPTARTARPKS